MTNIVPRGRVAPVSTVLMKVFRVLWGAEEDMMEVWNFSGNFAPHPFTFKISP